VGAERVKLYKLLVVDGQFDQVATLTFSTGLIDLTFTLPAGARKPIKLRMPPTARGRYAQLTIRPQSTMRLFSVALYGRRIGEPSEASWAWVGGPVDPTPEEWSNLQIPIPPTPEEWNTLPVPVPPTPEEWNTLPVPIPPTPEEWITQPLPIPVTPEDWALLQVPIPATAELPEWAALPMDQ
jgi:hypothetical protein